QEGPIAVPFIVRFMTGFWAPRKIQILGMEFAGQVESVDKAVTRFGEGDQVFGSTGFKFGAHAEYLYLHQGALLAINPANRTVEDATAVSWSGGRGCWGSFLKGLIEAGKLRTVIDRRYSLDEIAEAHRYVEAGHKKGNVVIILEQTSR